MGWGLKAVVGLAPGLWSGEQDTPRAGDLGQVGAGETGVQDGRRES